MSKLKWYNEYLKLTTVKFSDRYLKLIILSLATIGIIDTGTITLDHWGWIKPVTCNGINEGCEQTLQSIWGIMFGQPLSLFGFFAYLIIFLCTISSILLPDKKQIGIHLLSRRIAFFVSLLMANFSILLMSLLVFKIKVFCVFCCLSAVLSITLLLLNVIRTPKKEYDQLIFDSTLMSLLISTFGLIWAIVVDINNPDYSKQPIGISPEIVSQSDTSKIEFAEFLTKTGITLYSIYWCPHCHDQKELFGREAVSKLTTVECGTDGENNQHSNCKEKGITGFPSWDFPSKSDTSLLQSGIKSLNQLAELTGYKKD